MADPYGDIDFEEIGEATSLEVDEIKVLKLCFNLFDTKKQEFLDADDLEDILRVFGFRPSKEELQEILEEIDEDGSGESGTNANGSAEADGLQDVLYGKQPHDGS